MEADLTVVVLIATNQDNGPILWHVFKPMCQLFVRFVTLRKPLMHHVGQGDVPKTWCHWALPARAAEVRDHVVQVTRMNCHKILAIAVVLRKKGRWAPSRPWTVFRIEIALQLLELFLSTVFRLFLEACHSYMRASPAWVCVKKIGH